MAFLVILRRNGDRSGKNVLATTWRDLFNYSYQNYQTISRVVFRDLSGEKIDTSVTLATLDENNQRSCLVFYVCDADEIFQEQD